MKNVTRECGDLSLSDWKKKQIIGYSDIERNCKDAGVINKICN